MLLLYAIMPSVFRVCFAVRNLPKNGFLKKSIHKKDIIFRQILQDYFASAQSCSTKYLDTHNIKQQICGLSTHICCSFIIRLFNYCLCDSDAGGFSVGEVGCEDGEISVLVFKIQHLVIIHPIDLFDLFVNSAENEIVFTFTVYGNVDAAAST